MGEIRTVVWSRRVARQLNRLPIAIREKFHAWVAAVRLAGLREVRKTPGFHDEPLKGDRKGQRSVRLNLAWRAIYVERIEGIELIEVIEVTHHDY